MTKNKPKQFPNSLTLRRSAMDENALRTCSEKIENCLKKNLDIPQLTENIKEELEKNQNGYGWNVVIGKDFGSHIFHRSKYFANYYVGELEIIVWRSQLNFDQIKQFLSIIFADSFLFQLNKLLQ